LKRHARKRKNQRVEGSFLSHAFVAQAGTFTVNDLPRIIPFSGHGRNRFL